MTYSFNMTDFWIAQMSEITCSHQQQQSCFTELTPCGMKLLTPTPHVGGPQFITQF